MTINIPKGPLAAFRSRALKSYPREYGELLYGTIGKAGINIRRFQRVGHLNGTGHFWYDPDQHPERIGRNILLGLLHTHPDSDAAPGDADWLLALTRHFVLHGICRIEPTETPKTKIAFYLGVGGMLRIKLV